MNMMSEYGSETKKKIKATTVVWDYVAMGDISLTCLSVAVANDLEDSELCSILWGLTPPWRIRESLRKTHPDGGDIRYMTTIRLLIKEFKRRELPLDMLLDPKIIDEKW